LAPPIIGALLTKALTDQWSLWAIVGCAAAGIIVTFLFLRWQARSGEESPEAIKEQVSQLQSELRSQVQSRSYGARSKLIAAPLKELDLDITPRVGWVRDPRLTKPEPLSEETADIVAVFTSSKRRLLIVGEPGAGKTTAAYALIEHLDEREGDERVSLLVNLSAWEAQDTFEAFLVDYLVSEVGYQVRQPAVASAFIQSRRYILVLDGLDEIPAGLRKHFSERLNEFVRGLSSEVAVVVTCRTQEYQELFAVHPTGLGLVQAVEILPLTSQQLDSAFVELAKYDDKDWEILLTQRHLKASQRARDLLSNPLFLNLAVAGRLRPGELLNCDEEQELRDLVLERYLDRVLEDQSEHEPKDVRRYLTWIAHFLNGAEVSPFGLKTPDSSVFDLANLTPPDPPRRYRLFEALGAGLLMWLLVGVPTFVLGSRGETGALVGLLLSGLSVGLIGGLPVWLLAGWPFKRSAVSTRVALVWPSTRGQLLGFLRRIGLGVVRGLVVGLVFGMFLGMVVWMFERPIEGLPEGLGVGLLFGLLVGLGFGLIFGLGFGLIFGLVFGLVEGLLDSRSGLITSRTPKEASSRSLKAALLWLVVWVGLGLVFGLAAWTLLTLDRGLVGGLQLGLVLGLSFGLGFGLRNGGGFVVLQKVAHRHLARAGNLPPRPADFLEWGIERQIFRRVGGGVRFRHSLLQQHLAPTSVGEQETSTVGAGA